MRLVDSRGQAVTLGRCIGRGGEGTAYAVAEDASLAAKLYARRPGEAAVAKLEAMIALGTPELDRVAAWPKGLLHDGCSREVVGFLMPRVERHQPVHAVYCPATRKLAMPEARWSFLVRTAGHLAAAFETVHAHGHVVGDVNQGNVVVSPRGLVRLIDCDSFQVRLGDRVHPCPVGVSLFTPPELQRGGFANVERTRDHDAFGLAVLVFHLLFMGRHPYAGCRPGRDVPVDTAIREGTFAYGEAAAREGWTPPPFALHLSDLPEDLALLFERAFTTGVQQRPTAAQWTAALGGLEAVLATCAADERHEHASPQGACPWCRIEAAGGPAFFDPGPRDPEAVAASEIVRAWRAIEAVRSPGPAGPPPVPPRRRRAAWSGRLVGQVLQPHLRWRYFLAGASATFAAASVALREPVGGLGLLGLWALRPTPEERALREARRRAAAECRAELRRLSAVWSLQCGDAGFTRRRHDLEVARRALEGLAPLEEQERQHLGVRVARARLQRQLRAIALVHADVPGVEERTLQRLERCGLLSAGDLTPLRLARVPGLDDRQRSALLAWVRQVGRRFEFDPATDLREEHRLALGRRQRRRRESLVEVLRQGASELARCREAVLNRRRELRELIQRQAERLSQLERDQG